MSRIDELSSKVLHSYRQKAGDDVKSLIAKASKKGATKKDIKKYDNRLDGRELAKLKITQEEVEPLNEAVGHYVSKDSNGNTYHVHIVKNKKSDGHSLYLSNQHGNSLDRGSLNVAHAAKGHVEHQAKADETIKHFEKGGHAAAIKHLETISKSKWSHVKEAVEPIEELSKKVLGSYVNKASRDAGVRKQLAGIEQNKRDNATDKKQEFHHDDEAWAHTHKAEKRHKGISGAVKRLTTEEALSEAVKSGNEGHGFHGQAYLASMAKNKSKDHNHAEVADKEYAATHKKVRDLVGADDTTVKHYLDSHHGRHLHGQHNNPDHVKKDFKLFKKTYKPELFESYLIDRGLNETTQEEIDADLETGEVKAFVPKKKAKKDHKSAFVQKAEEAFNVKKYIADRAKSVAKSATRGSKSLVKTAFLRGIVK